MTKTPIRGLAKFLPSGELPPLDPKMAIHPDKAAAQKMAARSPAIQAVEQRLSGAAAEGAAAKSVPAWPRGAASAAEGAAAKSVPAWSKSTAIPAAADEAAGSIATRAAGRALPVAAKTLGYALQFLVPGGELGRGSDRYTNIDNLPVTVSRDGQMHAYEPPKPTFQMQTPQRETAPPRQMPARSMATSLPSNGGLRTDVSVVDFLKSKGGNSDYQSRIKMAQALGIDNYRGTAAQNMQMLDALKRSPAEEPQTTPQRLWRTPADDGIRYTGEPETTPQRMMREQPVQILPAQLPTGMPRQQQPLTAPQRNLPPNDPRRTTNFVETAYTPGQPPQASPSPEAQKIRKALASHETHFTTAGKSAGVDEDLLRAMAYHESRGKAGATSAKGAGGVMQLMPATFKAVGGTNISDPADNIGAGARYMAQMLKRYNGNIELALAAYNAGPGRVKAQIPDIKETKSYVAKVMAAYRALKGTTEQT